MTEIQAAELPSLGDVEQAMEVVRGAGLHRTPTWRSTSLSNELGVETWLKLELLQKTGSFKARGASVKIASLGPAERERGVIAVSAGNHACALAYAASAAGVSSTIVTWETAPEVKLVAARAYGGETLRMGKTPLEAFAAMERLRAERGLVLAHPFDDRFVMAGQGTVALELLEDVPEAATVVVPIGGGGLIGGIAVALRARRPGVRIVGVEPEGAPTLTRALAAGDVVPLEEIRSIADGLSAPMAGRLTLPAVRDLVDDVVLVSDDEMREAMRFLALRAKIVAEPAGAAGVAALTTGKAGPLTGPVVVVVSGGNVDPALLASCFAES
jgi:threonine dehydratase